VDIGFVEEGTMLEELVVVATVTLEKGGVAAARMDVNDKQNSKKCNLLNSIMLKAFLQLQIDSC
jgi:hypothetical protein